MKNGIHLEDAEFFKLKPNYLKSVKKVGLGKQFQVSGYFYVKQTSFLWIVLVFLSIERIAFCMNYEPYL